MYMWIQKIVKATDIPMDGNVYYFPKADGSVIYGKQWLPNGTTKILSFKAVCEEDVESPASDLESLKTAITNELTDVFMDRASAFYLQEIDLSRACHGMVLCTLNRSFPCRFYEACVIKKTVFFILSTPYSTMCEKECTKKYLNCNIKHTLVKNSCAEGSISVIFSIHSRECVPVLFVRQACSLYGLEYK